MSGKSQLRPILSRRMAYNKRGGGGTHHSRRISRQYVSCNVKKGGGVGGRRGVLIDLVDIQIRGKSLCQGRGYEEYS